MKIQKRLAIGLLILATLIVSLLMLSSCSECIHEWSDETVVIEEATCQRSGLIMKTCKLCGEKEIDDITAEHKFTNYVDDGNVTCSTNGTKTAKCENAGCNATHSIIVEASGHTFTNYVAVDADCILPSAELAVCDICKTATDRREVENATPAKGHKFRGGEVCLNEGCNQVADGLTLIGTYDISAEGSSVTAALYQTSDKIPNNASKYQHRLVIEGEGETVDFVRGKAPWSGFSDLITQIKYKGNITYIGKYAFYDFTRLTEASLPSSVNIVSEGIFEGCTRLTAVALPESIYVIDIKAFLDCDELADINLNETGLIQINANAFEGCKAIEAISLPDTTTAIGQNAFLGCTALADFEMSESISIISSTIFNNTAITLNEYEGAMYLGDGSVDYKYLITAKDAKITSCKVNKDTALVAYDAFVNCKELAELTADDDSVKYIANGNCLIEKDTGALALGIKTSLIPTDGTVTSIASLSFYSVSGLESITIPAAVEYIEQLAFSLCDNLKAVVVENGVKTIEPFAFADCNAIAEITLPFTGVGNAAIENSTFFGWIFGGIEYVPASLVKVTLTDIEEIAEGAFYGCNKIKEITIPATVKAIGGSAFVGCTSLSRVNIESLADWCAIDFADYYSNPLYVAKYIYINGIRVTSLTGDNKIPEGVEEIKFAAFVGAAISAITLPETLVTIGDSAFVSCTALTSVTLPDSVENLGAHAFAGCKSLESVSLSASLKSIKAYTFLSCESLIEIAIPASCKGIDLTAFNSCRRLAYIAVDEDNTVYYSVDGALALLKTNEVIFTPDAHIPTEE